MHTRRLTGSPAPRFARLFLGTLLTITGPLQAVEPAQDESPAKELTPIEERAKAFAKPVRFHSKGYWKAVVVKFDRDFHATLSAVKRQGKFTGVKASVVDHVKGNKTFSGVLDVNRNGGLRAHTPELVNIGNIVAIDPVLRGKLVARAGPFATKGQLETGGEIRVVECSHKRVGEVADDGSMQVETTTTSADGQVRMVTVTTLAPDGLPWLAETKGTVKKGPVNLEVNVHLTRGGITAKPDGE